MILNDRSIIEMASRGLLISENFEEKSVTPNGYDLRIDIIYLNGVQSSEAVIGANQHFLIATIEVLNLPDNVIGNIWTRSTFARKGLLGSFGAIDAGYHGNLTLSFFNASSSPISLERGTRIAQIIFMVMAERAKVPYGSRSGTYQHSQGIVRNPEDAANLKK